MLLSISFKSFSSSIIRFAIVLGAFPDSIEEIRMSNFNDSDFLFPSNWDFLSFSSLICTLFFSQHAMQIHSEILPYQLLFS
jgi:hypothetical protein